jgi:hypothetical protein
MDLYVGGHCGNGGSYGRRPIKTRLLEIDPESPALTDCVEETELQTLLDCALGPEPEIASSPDAFPWLLGTCLDAEPACP